MKIAIVHDYLNQFGGAERVVSAIHEIWPNAPIFTSIYNKQALPRVFQQMDIRTSFMQRFPFIFNIFKWYLLFYPIAFESFNLNQYDVILSSSSAFAKGIRKRDDQLHICYCHTPMRFVWRYDDYVAKESIPPLIKNMLPFILEPVKRWDLQTAEKVDYFIANSQNIANRIKQTYDRNSAIINPPVESTLFKPSGEQHDYFLVVSRLNSYKRLDIVIKAFNQLDLPLKIIGNGPDRRNLGKIASPNIEFLGRMADQQLTKYIAQCRALIFPGEEDFGIVPLEAMAAGRPVIAYRAGGAEETVIDGETGVFFEQQTVDSLILALKRFQMEAFDKNKLRQHAEKFDKEIFKSKLKDYVEQKYWNRKV